VDAEDEEESSLSSSESGMILLRLGVGVLRVSSGVVKALRLMIGAIGVVDGMKVTTILAAANIVSLSALGRRSGPFSLATGFFSLEAEENVGGG